MSYSKSTNPLENIGSALAQILPEEVTAETRAALMASGVSVVLDDGVLAWAACVPQDNLLTPFLELLTVVVAGHNTNQIMVRSNGEPVHRVFWNSVDPVIIATQGLDNVRRGLLLLALGEEPEDEFAVPRSADRSIRTVISVAQQIAAPATDVL